MRPSTGRSGSMTTPATPAPVRPRTRPDRPRRRARCAEQILANHDAHGHWKDRRDSSRSSPPSLQARHRPRPRTLRQERYCVIQQNASSISPRCQFYTRPLTTCLPTPAHGCSRILQTSRWDDAVLITEIGGNHEREPTGTSVVNDPGHVRMTSRYSWRRSRRKRRWEVSANHHEVGYIMVRRRTMG